MGGLKQDVSNTHLRRQKSHAVPALQVANQVAPIQPLNNAQKLARQKQARRTTHAHRGQDHKALGRDEPYKRHNTSQNDDEDFRSTTGQSLVLSPRSYRQKTSDDRNKFAEPPSTALFVNPEYVLLPVVKNENSRSVFDFYVNSYATSIIEISPTNVQSYTMTIHQILHDELLFTACTTTSEAARWRSQSLFADPPLNVVRGYGKTIQLLQRRLQSEPFALTTIAIMVMGQLTAIETLIKNVSASARHLAGMNMVMKMRPGASSTGNLGGLQTAVDVWSEYFGFRETITKTIPKFDPPTYPRHPFNPKLSMQVASLPPGFNDIVLSGRISTEMLELMDRFSKYYDRLADMNAQGIFDTRERTSLIVETIGYCFEYVQIRLLSTIERFILVALTAYAVRRDRVHPFLINTRNYFQICCANLCNVLSSPTNGLHREDMESDLLKWIGSLLLLTSSPEAHARKLALRILPKRPEPMSVLRKCQQFFWDEDLTNAFLSGNTLISSKSNDIITENVEQDLAATETERSTDTENGRDDSRDSSSKSAGDDDEYGALLDRANSGKS